MTTYQTFTFNREAFNRDMLEIEEKCLKCAIEYIQGNEYFVNGEVVQVPSFDGMTLAYHVYASQLKAWVVEYGQGASIDKSNPFLSEYLRSGLTHPNRLQHDGRVLKRGSAGYNTVNFSTNKVIYRDKGGEPEGTEVGKGMQKLLDRKPEPFLEDLIKDAYKAFEEEFNFLTSNLDISRYILISSPQRA